MEAKEKAVELVKKFDDFTVVWIEEETCYRSPKKANELIDEQIFLTMKSISGTFKEDSLLKEVEEERLKISLFL